jgi:hypothetical protein
MAERPSTGNDALPARRATRKERHRALIQAPPEMPAPADLEPTDSAEPRRPAHRSAPAPAARPFVRDQTGDAIRRPAQLSERCATCGALTRGRTGMVTELVQVGPVRALRVVSCSACPPKPRRGIGP